MFKKTLLHPIRIMLLTAVLTVSLNSNATSQTVGDTFIDTSEWVQSTSPIRTNGVVNGHITETIVRGYRGPDYDRYYNSNSGQNAIEFSSKPKIQPIVYENSEPADRTSLEPPLRPTPDPALQAANQATYVESSLANGQVRPASYTDVNTGYTTNVRGFPQSNTQASYAASPQVPGRMIQTGYVPPIVQPHQSFQTQPLQTQPLQTPGFQNSVPAPTYYASTDYFAPNNYGAPGNYGVSNYGNPYPNAGYVTTQFATPPNAPATNAPTAYTSTLTNCCDPVYRQAQFVAPNMNSGAGSLRTYPQYNGNPYPNPGYGISQPYVRDTWAPIIPLRQMPYGTYLGQGIVGQPVAYVDGEPVRNFLRYVFP